MKTSFVYSNSFVYSMIMKVLYGRFYRDRFIHVASKIPNTETATVLDICCGDCALFKKELANRKEIKYSGIEINSVFIKEANDLGIDVKYGDVLKDNIPKADYIILQGSLYQFYPNCDELVKKLLASTKKKLIISEPVRNLSDSSNPFISFFSKRSADPGDGHKSFRFNKKTLVAFFKENFGEGNLVFEEVPGGRDLTVVLSKEGI